MSIKQLVEEKDHTNLIFNGEYYDEVKDFIDNGIEKVYKIITKTGNSIKLTKNHDVITLDESGMKKIKVKNLKGTEEILLKRGIPDCDNYPEKIKIKPVDEKKIYHNVVHYPIPEFLTPELAELVGMITADGTCNDKSIHYLKRHKECVQKFAELIKICFNKILSVKEDPRRTNAWLVECNSKYIKTFLYDNFDGINNKDKFISSLIMQSGQFIQNGFLMGNSKGLENKNVIVTGARLYSEEERKIAYVAATRAEQSLYWCPSICRRGKPSLCRPSLCRPSLCQPSLCRPSLCLS